MKATGWTWRRLDALGSVGRGKSRHRPRNEPNLYGGPYPFIQTADVMAATPYITSYSQTYSELGLRQSKMWPANTLCMTIAGANTAKVAILKIEACFPDSVVGFIPDRAKADLHFVMYSLGLMKDQFLAVSRGATQDNLGLDKLLSFPLFVPAVNDQRRIGAIVSAYDELIENNKRRSALLEKMAEEIYREWFVRLRFPSHESLKKVRGMPEGWRTIRFSDLCEFQKGKTQKEVFAEPQDDCLPYINVESLEGQSAEYVIRKRNSIVSEDGDVLMLMDGARSGLVFRAKKGIVGSTFARIAVKPLYRDIVFEFLRASREHIVSNNTGSAIPHANKTFINQLLLFLPASDELIAEFNSHYRSFFEQNLHLQKQNEILLKSRNLLLRRLVSGKLSVENLDIQFPPGMEEELKADLRSTVHA
jgi:type I restriction enzyme S subunit